MNASLALVIAAVVAAAVVLRFMLWRALLVLAPSSVRVEPEDPPGQAKVPPSLAKMVAELKALGFAALGTHSERPPLGPQMLCFDFARLEDGTFATAWITGEDTPRLYFLSMLASGGFVITANYRRLARAIDGQYLSGGLENVPPDRLFKAHVRLLEGHAPSGDFTLDGRVSAARAWYAGPGRAEVRLQNFPGLLWSVGTLGMVAAAILANP
jgi:hypothetical protein